MGPTAITARVKLLSCTCGFRMKGKKAKERTEAAKELEQNIHLVKAPGVMKSEPGFSLPKLAEKTKVKVSTSSKVEMQE